jgi:hypothetical protein
MNRTGKGGFVSGQSGNPGGRPKSIASLTIESRKYAFDAIRTLARITKSGRSETARIAAAVALLDRGFGRPSQSVEMNLTADMVSKRISELSDRELTMLEQRMIVLDGADLDGEQPELGLLERRGA